MNTQNYISCFQWNREDAGETAEEQKMDNGCKG